MTARLIAISMLVFAGTATMFAAPPVELELATERGVQITAPQQWLQLLAGVGIQNVRIRPAGRAGGAQRSEEPRVTQAGTTERPSFRMLGIITTRDQLRLPGGTFNRSDRAKLKDYFDRLGADGAESLTLPRGMFGLTEPEIKTVFAELAQPINFETARQLPRAVIEQLQAKLSLKIDLNDAATTSLNASRPLRDEMKGLATGTALAMLLHNHGLALRPEKPRGQAVVLRVIEEDRNNPRRAAAGKTSDSELKHWPVGWEPHETPGRTAPALFEIRNAEIDGYTLEETLDAIAPRITISYYYDRAALIGNDIDPTKVQVRVPRTRTSYKRVIDRALSHARLHSQVRVDEAGQPFLWISR
jgi:hypothetical protein